MAVHLFSIVSIGTICKWIVGRRGGGWSGKVAVEEKRAMLGGDRPPGPASWVPKTPQGMPLQHDQSDGQ